MNLPNKLTVMRVILIPFFVAALLYDNGSSQTMRVVANVIFIVASLTDLFDGKIARKYCTSARWASGSTPSPSSPRSGCAAP